MAQGEERYIIAAAAKVLEVEDWLVFGADPLEWQTAKQVAAGAGLSADQAYRLLMTMKSKNRVEQSDKGWRISPEGIIRHSFRIQEVLAAQQKRFGPRRLIEP